MVKENINMEGLMESREAYEAPVIETVEVRIEQGFQETGGSRSLAEPGDDNDGNTW